MNLNKHECLTKKTYVSFFKNYNIIKDGLNWERIECLIGGKDIILLMIYVQIKYYNNH